MSPSHRLVVLRLVAESDAVQVEFARLAQAQADHGRVGRSIAGFVVGADIVVLVVVVRAND